MSVSPGTALAFSNPALRCTTPIGTPTYYSSIHGNNADQPRNSLDAAVASVARDTASVARDTASVARDTASVARDTASVARETASSPEAENSCENLTIQTIKIDCIGDDEAGENAEAVENNTNNSKTEKAAAKLTRTQYLVLITICLSSMCGGTFYSLLAPFFPTEGENKGISNTAVGIILSSFQLIVFLTSPVWGIYMTRIGAKFMFVTGIMVTSVCAILFGMLEWCPPGTIYLVMCVVVRSVEALGNSAAGTASLAIASHTFPDRVSLVMGFQQACSSFGLMVGPPIGGVLFSAGGFMLPFVTTGAIYILGGLGALVLLPSFSGEEKAGTPGARGSAGRWTLMKVPVLLAIGYTVLVGQAAIGFIDVALALHVAQFNLSPALVGLIFLIPSGMIILMAPMVGLVVDKKKSLGRYLLIVGVAIGTFGFLLLGPSPLIMFIPSHRLWMVMLALGIAGFGWSGIVIAFQEYVYTARKYNFPDDLATNGLISGVFNSFGAFGAFLGPLVGGFMNEHLHFEWASTIIGGFCALAVVFLVLCTLWEWCCRQCSTEGTSSDRETLISET